VCTGIKFTHIPYWKWIQNDQCLNIIYLLPNNILQKTKSNTLESIAVERHHNSTDNQPVVIARLELFIDESQIFISFWSIVLAMLSTLMVGIQQVWKKIWYARYNDKDKAITRLYAEKQLHINSLTLRILFTMWYQLYDKVNHLSKTISYFTISSIGHTTQIIVAHCDFPSRHNQSKPSQNPLILQGLHTAHNHEHDYHDSLYSTEVCTMYPWVVIPSPFDD
jgi:hypothetical protein